METSSLDLSRAKWSKTTALAALEAHLCIYAAISIRSLGILLKYSDLASSFPTSFLADPLLKMDRREALVDL